MPLNKSRRELPWLYYPKANRVIINAHNFPAPGGTWSPADISTDLWLDGSDASTLYDATSGGSLVAADGTIARWEDKSGNARHVTQGTAGSRPLRKTSVQNSLDAVRFTSDYLEKTSFTPQARSIFSIQKSTTSSGTQSILRVTASSVVIHRYDTANFRSFANAGTLFDAQTSASPTSAEIVESVFDTSLLSQWVNGIAGSTDAGSWTNLASSATLEIGGRVVGTEMFAGDIFEFILLSTVVDTTTRQKIEGYLAHKWGTTASLDSGHPYKSVAP